MGKVTYVVTTYGKQNLLLGCLQSFRKFHQDDPLIVVDNGGPDLPSTESICKIYDAQLIRFNANGSLSKVMNEGMEWADTPYVCICNNDIEFTTRLTEQFEKDFEDERIVIVGGLLFYPDGKIQHGGGRRFWNAHAMGHYGQGKYPHQAKLCSIPAYRLYVTGAMSAVRKSWWLNHRYDEQMEMGCEDTDLCLRSWSHGKRVFYDPEITAIHLEGATRGRTIEEKRINDPLGMVKEKRAYEIFQSVWTDAEMKKIDDEVNRLNLELHPDLPVAFVRNGATGDVLRTLGTYDRMGFTEKVVITQIPEAFRDRKCRAISKSMDEYAVSSFIDLDMAYERRRDLSMEQAYSSVVGGREDVKNSPIRLKTTALDWMGVKNLEPNFEWDKPFVAIHFGQNWAGKTLPPQFWDMIYSKIVQKGFGVVCVGAGNDYGMAGPRTISLVNRTTLHGLRAVFERAKLFIGNDSAPLHLADGACPAIGLFTVTIPEKVVSDQVTGFVSSAPCAGCQLRRPGATDYRCDYPQNDIRQFMCTQMFDPEEIVKKAYELLGVK